ncbi:hypothetical protein HYN48_04235 [Flavobacterium magnum]|uniref:Acyloxyacyl hydrolase n=1 Tax=Flavobacterium magnum TaxID=2162713 RepID=A0A2S0RBF0_9FLAO|nr:acyloxyacyl hydrolase [Flavobacterium magnum]AWA29357.1 hypothetical protein HYN48_04235 [Flavobacterium magnum]
MYQKLRFLVCGLLVVSGSFAQQVKKHPMAVGLHFGFGDEIRNTDYTYTNHYIKPQLYWQLKKSNHFTYQILLQPEINFATHQLINLYFVTPEEPDYEAKRARYTKLKDIREYVLNVGFLVRRPITEKFSIYVLGSVGPMITDTETERLSRGFAFSDVLSLGFSYRVNGVTIDLRPNLRHTSNAGLQSSNAGFNTANLEFGLSIPL